MNINVIFILFASQIKMNKQNKSSNFVEYYISIYVGCNKEEPQIIKVSNSYENLNNFMFDFIGKNISDLELDDDDYEDSDNDSDNEVDFEKLETYRLDKPTYSKIKDKLDLMHFCASRIVIYKSKTGNIIDILQEIKDNMV